MHVLLEIGARAKGILKLGPSPDALKTMRRPLPVRRGNITRGLTLIRGGPRLDRLNAGISLDGRRTMEIRVEGSLDQAMRVLKRKLAKEGVFKEM